VPWDDTTIQRLVQDLPYFAMVTIPPGIYRGHTEGVRTWGVQATLVGTTRLPEEVAYVMAKSVFDSFDEFTAQSPIFTGITRETAARAGQSAPYHPGTLRYFREVALVQ